MKEKCTGKTCEWGDTASDELIDSVNYDGSECMCRKCKNFDVCTTWTPNKSRLCLGCKQTFGGALKKKTLPNDCAICLNANTQLFYHPSGCTHAFCGECLMGCYNARPDQPLPSEYGLRRTCACESMPAPWGTNECDACSRLLQQWENTDEGYRWAEACMDMDTDNAQNKKCPLCRKCSK